MSARVRTQAELVRLEQRKRRALAARVAGLLQFGDMVTYSSEGGPWSGPLRCGEPFSGRLGEWMVHLPEIHSYVSCADVWKLIPKRLPS